MPKMAPGKKAPASYLKQPGVFAFTVTCLLAPPMIGSSGINGESVPNEIMKPVFLLEVIQMTVVPLLTQKSWLFLAFGTLGLTLAELPDLVMLTVQGFVAEPQVLSAVHKLAGSGSLHANLLLACVKPQASSTMHDTMSNVASCF